MTSKATYAKRRAKWLAWLRDPTNKQARGRLHDGDSFCCLGGACEVSKLGKWDENNFYLDSSSILPPEVAEWLGMASNSGLFDYLNLSAESRSKIIFNGEMLASRAIVLVQLNDYARMTFAQIADFIETNPAGLWKEGTY